MRLAAYLENTAPAAIAALHARLRSSIPGISPVLNMGQGVPDIRPPTDCLSQLARMFDAAPTHLYSADEGLIELRRAIANDYRARVGVEIDPESEIVITAGANHGFFLAVSATVNSGDKVLIPSPWYFNHAMALQMLGATATAWPMCIDREAWSLDFDGLPALLSQSPTGIICVNPNNPTGAVYDTGAIRQLTHECVERDIWLYFDEVYARLRFDGQPGMHPFEVPGGREHTIVLGSFSKQYGMTGWRVGYLIAPRTVISQVIKAQDTTLICAPTAGQLLAQACLERHPDHPAPYRKVLRHRAARLADGLSKIAWLAWRRPEGAIFSLVRYFGNEPSESLAERLFRDAGVLVVPGSAFGPGGEQHIRLSFGFSDDDAIDEFVRRISTISPP